MRHPFTISHYKEIIRRGLECGFKYCLFSQSNVPEHRIYMRHDVDNSVDSAFEIAQVEAELGVKSTYLFLLRSENYNILSGNSLKNISGIHAMGHEIGLHFSLEEHEVYGSKLPLIELIKQDAEILSELLNIEIKVFSFHNPAGKDQFKIEVPGLINTYHQKFFDNIKYISESNMVWREKCPCEMFRERHYNCFQVLIHPMTYCDNLQTDEDVLLYFLYEKVMKLKRINETQNRILAKKGVSMAELTKYFTQRAVNYEK